MENSSFAVRAQSRKGAIKDPPGDDNAPLRTGGACLQPGGGMIWCIQTLSQRREILKRREEYERENNTKVTEAKYFREPGKESAFFNNISNKSVLTHNGVMCRWSSIGTINFYTNRKFEGEFLENSKEIYEKYTQQKEEGYCKNFVIIENVLYYTIAI